MSEQGGRGDRPRLFFTAERLAALRERIEKDAASRAAWEKLLARAETLLDQPFIPEAEAEGGKGQHGDYYRPGGRVRESGPLLGLAYHLTGEERYAERLRETLRFYAGYAHWYGPGFRTRQPVWRSELATAMFLFGYAVGYDCLRDTLPEAERTAIAEGMIRLGILPTLEDWVLPETRIHALDSMGHNWWSVCVAMAGMGALSLLGDEPRAREWVEQVARAFPLWFAYRGNVLQNKCANFDAGGAFYESIGYTNYALSEYLLFRIAYADVFPGSPLPPEPLLERAGEFLLHSSYADSEGLYSVNFGDQGPRCHAAATARLLLADGQEDPHLRWYVRRTDPGLNSALGLVLHEPDRPEAPPHDLPRSIAYPEIGWAMLRSGWEDNATLLAVKCGFTWNHAHADAGSFALYHAGKPLLIDSGNCDYGRPEYKGYYCQSRAHNVVLFNGEGQDPEDIFRGVKHPGHLHELVDMGGLRYLYADATGPTAHHFARNYRHFLWVDGAILILDDVRAHQAGQFQWLLHYAGTATRGTEGWLVENEGTRALVQPLFPAGLSAREEDGLADHHPEQHIPYLSFSPAGESREEKFLTALLPLAPDATAPEVSVEPLEGEEMLGARLHLGGQVTEVYWNLRADGRRMHENSNHVLGGWETDATLIALTRPTGDADQFTRLFMANGSYLRRDGHAVADSLAKVTLAAAWSGEELQVSLQGQPLIEATLAVPCQPGRVRLNGALVPTECRGGRVRLSVRG